MVAIDDIKVAGQSINYNKGQIRGIVDTGTSALVGDRHIVDIITNAIGAVKATCVNKGELPEVEIVIGGKSYPLTSESYVIDET